MGSLPRKRVRSSGIQPASLGFRIFYVALNTPRADDYHPVMVLCASSVATEVVAAAVDGAMI